MVKFAAIASTTTVVLAGLASSVVAAPMPCGRGADMRGAFAEGIMRPQVQPPTEALAAREPFFGKLRLDQAKQRSVSEDLFERDLVGSDDLGVAAREPFFGKLRLDQAKPRSVSEDVFGELLERELVGELDERDPWLSLLAPLVGPVVSGIRKVFGRK